MLPAAGQATGKAREKRHVRRLTNWPPGQKILAGQPILLGSRETGKKEAPMILDNLFSMLGGVGTAAMLIGILTLIGSPAIGAVACPANGLRRLQRGR